MDFAIVPFPARWWTGPIGTSESGLDQRTFLIGLPPQRRLDVEDWLMAVQSALFPAAAQPTAVALRDLIKTLTLRFHSDKFCGCPVPGVSVDTAQDIFAWARDTHACLALHRPDPDRAGRTPRAHMPQSFFCSNSSSMSWQQL